MPRRAHLVAFTVLLGLPLPLTAQEPPRDALGDPLPRAAIARLGTTRLQHGYRILGLAFSPDGKVLVSAGGGSGVSFWEVPSGRLLHHLPNPEGYANQLALAPDGKTLATAGAGILRLWDFASRKQLHLWKAPGALVAFSRDGKLLITHTASQVALLDAATGQIHKEIAIADKRLGPGTLSVSTVALSPDNKLLAVGGYHRGLDIYEVETGKRREHLDKAVGFVLSVAFALDGKSLLVGGTAGLQVRDAKHFQPVRKFCLAPLWPERVPLADDGKVVPISRQDGTIEFWDPTTGKLISRGENGHGNRAGFVAVSRDGRVAASGGDFESHIALWDVAAGKLLFRRPGHRASVTALAVAPDGKLLASASQDRTILLWDLPAGEKVRRVYHGHRAVDAIAFAPDSTLLACSTGGGTTDNLSWIWDVGAGKKRHQLGKPKWGIKAFAFSPDGKRLFTGSMELPIQAWDPHTGKQLDSPTAKVERSTVGLALSPDGKKLASLHRERFVRLWDLEHGKGYVLGEHGREALTVAFAPDGRTVASGGRDGAVRIWDVTAGRELHACLAPGAGWVYAVAVSRDGRWLVSAGRDLQVRLWEVATGAELDRFPGHAGPVWALAFAPDGQRLFSASEDSSILVWDLRKMLGRGASQPAKHSAAELQELWTDLGGTDVHRGQRAVRAFAAAPRQAVALFTERFGFREDPAPVRRLVADLNAGTFAVREKAMTALRRLGPAIEPELRKALAVAPSEEARRRLTQLLAAFRGPGSAVEGVRAVRLVDVLEEIADADARRLLARMADELAVLRVGQEAAAALRRLGKGPAAP